MGSQVSRASHRGGGGPSGRRWSQPRGRGARHPVLIFHGIGDSPRRVGIEEQRYWCPRREWPGIADVLAEAVHGGTRVELTFDDGNASDVSYALPALVERGLTATFLVCAARLGRSGYLDARALLLLRQAGMAVGSHGWNHVDLRPLSDIELVHETDDSQVRIAEACESAVDRFSVPFGSYDRRVLRRLRGYSTVYTSDATNAVAHAWLVPRWTYEQGWTPLSVERLLVAGEPLRHRWRQKSAMAVKRWR